MRKVTMAGMMAVDGQVLRLDCSNVHAGVSIYTEAVCMQYANASAQVARC